MAATSAGWARLSPAVTALQGPSAGMSHHLLHHGSPGLPPPPCSCCLLFQLLLAPTTPCPAPHSLPALHVVAHAHVGRCHNHARALQNGTGCGLVGFARCVQRVPDHCNGHKMIQNQQGQQRRGGVKYTGNKGARLAEQPAAVVCASRAPTMHAAAGAACASAELWRRALTPCAAVRRFGLPELFAQPLQGRKRKRGD